MTKQFYVWLILLFSTTLFAQDNSQLDKDRIIKAEQILKDAQKAIGAEKINLNSFHLKTKFILDASMGEITDETDVLLLNNIRSVTTVEQPSSMKITRIWNENRYKASVESEIGGQRFVRDITNSSLSNDALKKVGNKIDKDKLDKLKESRKRDPKNLFYWSIWQNFFPLVLIQPFEQNLEFKYVGKAEVSKRFANIIDVKSKNGSNFRLLFDSETSLLLMMIESFKGEDGNYETKFYFSNKEVIDNVLIPKRIKVENKFTPTGKEPKISLRNIEILEFKLNPELKESMFEIK